MCDVESRRVVFYGTKDLAIGLQMARVVEIIEDYSVAEMPTETVDVIELHNVLQYIENGLLPQKYKAEQCDKLSSLVPKIRSAVARFFSAIDESNCKAVVADVNYNYHADLLALLGRYNAYKRCKPAIMLSALESMGVSMESMLACRELVNAYPSDLREKILAAPQNATHVIRKYLTNNVAVDVHLPANLSSTDIYDLLDRYLDISEANPNYLRLIETASSQGARSTGIDDKMRLKAKRRSSEMTEKLMHETEGIKIGVEVAICDARDEPVECEVDHSEDTLARFTYGTGWLEETLDYPSILNNFYHLFEFANQQGILNLPSYHAKMGTFERLITLAGKTEYQTGIEFQVSEMSSLSQTRIYQQYLNSKNINLEEVFAWFFDKYLEEEFNAPNFSFTPASSGTSYLEKARHLFVEMESVVKQFRLYVENGELDTDLLTISSNPVLYKQVPSLLNGKYIYPTQNEEITGVLPVLFSDQSNLQYIRNDLRGRNAAELFLKNSVTYSEFQEYQRKTVDQLISLGILENTGTQVRIANLHQFFILRSLWVTETASYFHLSEERRAVADAMEKRGWVVRRSSLLTEAEAAYFNFLLNKVDFSNGPDLRNKYLHGSQANANNEEVHFETYFIALKLMIALIIKINDDFCLSALEVGR